MVDKKDLFGNLPMTDKRQECLAMFEELERRGFTIQKRLTQKQVKNLEKSIKESN